MSDPAAPRPVGLQPETDGFVFPFLPIITPEIALAAVRKAASKDTVLSLHSPVVKHLAHVLNIIRWKLSAGPRCDSPSREQINEDEAAWQHWVRHGIWPEARQGYAVRTRHVRPDNIDVAALQATERELEELRKCQTGEELSLEQERATHKRKEKIAKLEKEIIPGHRRGVTDAEIRKRALEIGQPILNLRLIGEWHDFAMELRAIFCAELNQEPKRAPRFVAAVWPDVTVVTSNVPGKTVAVGTVRRFVNRHT
jgi:hypothetical protein